MNLTQPQKVASAAYLTKVGAHICLHQVIVALCQNKNWNSEIWESQQSWRQCGKKLASQQPITTPIDKITCVHSETNMLYQTPIGKIKSKYHLSAPKHAFFQHIPTSYTNFIQFHPRGRGHRGGTCPLWEVGGPAELLGALLVQSEAMVERDDIIPLAMHHQQWA